MSDRLFTPAAAREALGHVRPAAERLCRLIRLMEARRPPRIDSEGLVEPAYFRLLRDLQATIDYLTSSGARVKDPKQGLIDFPARRAGRSVWLCWRVGEPSVGYWHELETGLAGRRPIDEDGPWETVAEMAEMPG